MDRVISLFDPALIAALAGMLAAILTSIRVREILKDIFSKPKSRSVVVTIGDRTILVDDINPADIEKLIRNFVKARGADPPDHGPTAAAKGDGV